MTFKTTTGRYSHGWECRTVVELGPCRNHHGELAKRVLQITTSKHRRGISSHVQGSVLGDSGLYSFMLVGDFSKWLNATPGRATEAAVAKVHAITLGQIVAIETEARAFYAKDAEKVGESLAEFVAVAESVTGEPV